MRLPRYETIVIGTGFGGMGLAYERISKHLTGTI